MTLLFLNDFGTGELLFIMAVVLMLFGSKSIPSIARTLGKGVREIKNASNEIKQDIQRSAMDMKRDLNMQNPLSDIEKDIKQSVKEIEKPLTIDDSPEKKTN